MTDTEHDCLEHVEEIENTNAISSKRFRCKICGQLFHQTVNQFGKLKEEMTPYKCSHIARVKDLNGNMVRTSKNVCSAPVKHIYDSNGYCDAHLPRRRRIVLADYDNVRYTKDMEKRKAKEQQAQESITKNREELGGSTLRDTETRESDRIGGVHFF